MLLLYNHLNKTTEDLTTLSKTNESLWSKGYDEESGSETDDDGVCFIVLLLWYCCASTVFVA